MAPRNQSVEIVILMCVFNGQDFLADQLTSFLHQETKSWRLYVSDDGSVDNTLEIINEYKAQVGFDRVQIREGPKRGFAQNFMYLLTDPSIKADYYALSDQDDVWEKDKLNSALEYFSGLNPSIPALYCGRTLFVDENKKAIGYSNIPNCTLTFRNALVQNVASGNTMVINDAARNLIIQCGRSNDVYAHDWLLYLLVSGAGGNIFYDKRPLVRYRQHNNNQIGINTKLFDRLKRLRQFILGDFSFWSANNIDLLMQSSNLLTKKNVKILYLFSKARSSRGINSWFYLFKSGVYRQRTAETLVLYLGAFIGRI